MNLSMSPRYCRSFNTEIPGRRPVFRGTEKVQTDPQWGITSCCSSTVVNPIAGVSVSVPMITKGGLEAVSRSLASEYAKQHIRFNAVAPGIVDTPLYKNNNPKDFLKSLSPMSTISNVNDIVDAVVYLTDARDVTGEVLHVDGGAHSGKW